uniref:Uncharacterized protein n=1 Tax=Anopheles darlingi TaxID=43151 RepID=A0A2M4D863_ANODA
MLSGKCTSFASVMLLLLCLPTYLHIAVRRLLRIILQTFFISSFVLVSRLDRKVQQTPSAPWEGKQRPSSIVIEMKETHFLTIFPNVFFSMSATVCAK